MDEEEKQAVKNFEDLLKKHFEETSVTSGNFLDGVEGIHILNIIENQQKEIEELKDKNKTLEQLLQGNLYEMYKYYRELANSYQANCISKDKIRDIIFEFIPKSTHEVILRTKLIKLLGE